MLLMHNKSGICPLRHMPLCNLISNQANLPSNYSSSTAPVYSW